MSNRAILFNQIFHRMGYKSYLEIGVDNPNNTFNLVTADVKWAVDPYMDTTQCHVWNDHNKTTLMQGIKGKFYKKTSDEFFASIKGMNIKFDFIFIDGMHTEEQVDKDIANSLKHLKPGGMIIIDDCYPTNPDHIKMPPDPGSPWMGTVYKSMIKLARHQMMYDKMKTFVTGTLLEGTGMGFIKPKVDPATIDLWFQRIGIHIGWEEYMKNAHQYLGHMTKFSFIDNVCHR